MNTLFDTIEKPVIKANPPHNGTPTSKAAADSVRYREGTECSILASALHSAGERGMTIPEMVAAVTARYGKPVKETTMNARVNRLIKHGYAVKTDMERMGNSGRNVGVWVHKVHETKGGE